jgi:hypothetical protein
VQLRRARVVDDFQQRGATIERVRNFARRRGVGLVAVVAFDRVCARGLKRS